VYSIGSAGVIVHAKARPIEDAGLGRKIARCGALILTRPGQGLNSGSPDVPDGMAGKDSSSLPTEASARPAR